MEEGVFWILEGVFCAGNFWLRSVDHEFGEVALMEVMVAMEDGGKL